MTHYSALMLSIGLDIAVRRVQPITETKAINKVNTGRAQQHPPREGDAIEQEISEIICISFTQIGMAMTTATSELTRNLLAVAKPHPQSKHPSPCAGLSAASAALQ